MRLHAVRFVSTSYYDHAKFFVRFRGNDRKNPNGHYEVGNVRWALKDVQQTNKRGQWHVWREEILPDFDNELEAYETAFKWHATLCF